MIHSSGFLRQIGTNLRTVIWTVDDDRGRYFLFWKHSQIVAYFQLMCFCTIITLMSFWCFGLKYKNGNISISFLLSAIISSIFAKLIVFLKCNMIYICGFVPENYTKAALLHFYPFICFSICGLFGVMYL